MFYPELEAKIRAKEVLEGDLFWVTGYYHKDPLKEPTRHVTPTLVQVWSIRKDLSGGETAALFKAPICFFSPFSKSGNRLSKFIKPYDNAFSIYSPEWPAKGTLNFFLTEAEARFAYVEAAKVVRLEIAEAHKRAAERVVVLLAEVDNHIAENG